MIALSQSFKIEESMTDNIYQYRSGISALSPKTSASRRRKM